MNVKFIVDILYKSKGLVTIDVGVVTIILYRCPTSKLCSSDAVRNESELHLTTVQAYQEFQCRQKIFYT